MAGGNPSRKALVFLSAICPVLAPPEQAATVAVANARDNAFVLSLGFMLPLDW
jgi:hypothetical protein